MNMHHLILGTLKDFLSGEEIADTHDERYRQKIARFLVEERGFRPIDIRKGTKLTVSASGKKAMIIVDFLVYARDKTMMLIKYGPGSIITRHRSALAASRLFESYQIPVVVVTNGEDADVLCGQSGKIMGAGFDAIPGNTELLRMSERKDQTICAKRQELESRIVYAFEVDGSCPCDSDICRIES